MTSNNYFSNYDREWTQDRFYLFVGSGGSENGIATFIKRSKLGSPIILISYDLNNSLPAAMEARTYLENEGYEARIIHGSLEELNSLIRQFNDFERIKNEFKKSRIGMIGVPSDWLIASQINEKLVRENWGCQIVSVPISELTNVQKTGKSKEVERISETFIRNASGSEVSQEKIIEAANITVKLSQIAAKYQLNALTVECFALIQKTDISACFSFSYLNDQNIVAGCEGDIPTTFTMLLIYLLTGQSSFMANVTDVNLDQNSVKLAHCTIPTNLTSEYSITTHFETGKSVAVQGHLVPQEVTILKIGGKKLSKWWLTKGKIVSSQKTEAGCRTQIEVKIEKPVTYFLENSFANHHCVILGNHTEKIRQFLEFALT